MTPNRRSQRARMMELGRTMAPVKNGLDVGIAGDNPPGANREFFQLAEGGLWTTADFDTGQSPDRVLDITGTIPDDMKHQYDLVCCTQVLEHVWDLAQAADGLWVLTGWGGHCIVDVPFLYPPHGTAVEQHDYWRIAPQGLERLLKRAGFFHVETWADPAWLNTHAVARKGMLQ